MTINVFVPRFRYVIDITNEQYATVTFTDTHDFVLHEIISLRVSKPYGMFEINEKQAKVLAVGEESIVINIDTTNFNSFIYPVSGNNTPPQCVPVGSGINSENPFLVFNILEDEFDNVRIP